MKYGYARVSTRVQPIDERMEEPDCPGSASVLAGLGFVVARGSIRLG